MSLPNKRTQNLLSISFIVLALVVFYRQEIFGAKYIPFDSKDQVYPFLVFTTQTYRSGEIPLWNPYIYAGTPSFADPLYMTFYPGTLLYLIPGFLSQRWFDIVEMLHVLIGAIALFYLARDYEVHPLAAVAAALVFALGGPLTARLQHVTELIAASLLPLGMLLVRLGTRKRRLWLIGLAGVVLGSAVMVGYQVGVLIVLLVCCYFVFESWPELKSQKRADRKLLVYFSFLVFTAVCFSALQTIPSLEFAGLSTRPGYDYASASVGSVPPKTWLTTVFPDVFDSIDGSYWGPTDVTEGYLYFGLIPLGFISYSVSNWKKANRAEKFFLVIALLSALYALGKYTPIHRILFSLLPPLRLFKRPSDSLFIFHAGVSFSLAFAFDQWIRTDDTLPRRFLQGGLFLIITTGLFFLASATVGLGRPGAALPDWYFLPNLFFFALALGLVMAKGKLPSEILLLGLVLVLAADLTWTSSNRWFNSTDSGVVDIQPDSIYGCSDVVGFLKRNVGQEYRFEGVRAGTLWANAGAIWRLPSSVGYSPLVVGSYDQFASPTESWALRQFSGVISDYDSDWFDLLGVKYIVSAFDLREIDPHARTNDFPRIELPCSDVYENKDPLPLAFAVHQAIVTEGTVPSDSLTYLQADPATTVILDRTPGGLGDKPQVKDAEISVGHAHPGDSVALVQRTADTISIDVQLREEGVLVVNDVFYPGWRVSVDGKSAELLKTNSTFKGVVIQPGFHRVEFRFTPASFFVGLSLSLLAVISVILSLTIKSLRER